MYSPNYTLIKKDLKKVGTGLLIAMTGAGLTYIEQAVLAYDFGIYTEMIVVMNSVVVNAIRKYLASTDY